MINMAWEDQIKKSLRMLIISIFRRINAQVLTILLFKYIIAEYFILIQECIAEKREKEKMVEAWKRHSKTYVIRYDQINLAHSDI